MLRRVLPSLLAVLALVAAVVVPAAEAQAAPTGTAVVRLLDAHGAPKHQKGFVVTVSGTGVDYRESRTDSIGHATFRLPAGTFVFRVAAYRTDGGITDGYTYVVPVSSPTKVRAGASVTVGLRLVTGGTISGVARKAGGGALAYGTVAAATRDGAIAGFTTTDAHGAYAIRGLPTGFYVIVVNYRSWADPRNANVVGWGWGYYGGTTLASAKAVHTSAQTATKAATTARNIRASAPTGIRAVFSLATKDDASGQVQIERMTPAGEYIQADSVYGPVNRAGTTMVARVHGGYSYRIAVLYGGTKYFYTGPGLPLSTDVAQATPVTFSADAARIALGPTS